MQPCCYRRCVAKKQQQYRIRNWPHYNRALVGRGSLTLWLDTRSLDAWLSTDRPARRGRCRLYTDVAIRCCLMLREVYHLPLRAAEGLVCSLMPLLDSELPVPHYSTLSRRARQLPVQLLAPAKDEPRHLSVDSTGLKLYGEGEWKVRVHRWSKQRTWRKLHICLDAHSQQVTAAVVTHREVVDPRLLPRLLRQVEAPISRVTADGAYDSRECYRAIAERGARAVIPPRKGSTLWSDEYLKGRNNNLRQVRRLGVGGWKKRVEYHRRSLVETAISRLKGIFTDKVRSRANERQTTEVLLRCAALNRMTELGMPESYRV